MTLRRRRLRVAGVAVAAGLLVALVHPSLWAGEPGTAPPRHLTHVVAPGETLWSIAERNAPGGADGTDPRRYIYDLQQLNPAAARGLVPGETLTLP
jgi:Tfp pilus assembly protein FimV